MEVSVPQVGRAVSFLRQCPRFRRKPLRLRSLVLYMQLNRSEKPPWPQVVKQFVRTIRRHVVAVPVPLFLKDTFEVVSLV